MITMMRSLWLHFRELRELTEREEEKMRISVSELPVLRGGPGKIGVAIRGNGQVVISAEATKALEGCKYLAFTNFDAKTRSFEMRGLEKVPVKIAGETYTAADVKELLVSKKTKQAYFSGAGLCKHDAIGYDYKGSGNQNFEATVDAAKHTVSFTFPKGTLAAKPVTHRAKKGEKAAAAVAGANGTVAEAEEALELTE